MKTAVVWGLAFAAALGAATTAMAQDDDWEFQQDTTQNITVAAARYEAGQMIVVQCREGALTVVLTGLRGEAEEVQFQATRADGRRDIQRWRSAGTAGAFRSAVPARDVRFMRGGGAYTIQTNEGDEPALGATFDLPTESANLDRVLTACGWALQDDRDLLPRAVGVSFTDPNARPPRRSQSRSVQMRSRPSAPAAPLMPVPAEKMASCIVRDLRRTDCRFDHPATAAEEHAVSTLRMLEGGEMYAVDGVVTDGTVVYTDGPTPLIVVTRERLL